MGYDVALIGTLSFPPDKLEAWLADHVDAAGEWPAGMRVERAPAPVREVLASLASEVPGAPVHVVAGKQKLDVRVLLHEDAFLDAAARVARAFELAGAHGAKGALDLLGYGTSDLALRVEPSARPKKLAPKDAAKARKAKGYLWIEEALARGVEARVELPKGKAPKKAAAKSATLPIAREAALARMLQPYRVGGEVRWMVTTRHVPLTIEELLPLLDDPAIVERAPKRLELVAERTCARRRGKSFALGAAGAAALAEHPALARFEELSLFGAGVGDEGVEALAASPHARGLVALDLGDAGVADDGLVALTRLSGLRTLRVDGNNCKAKGIVALAGLSALERLDLPVDAPASAIVAIARAARRLRALAINYATLDEAACSALSELPLEHLRVFAPKVFAAKALGTLSQLRSFAYDPSINGAKLDAAALEALARAMPSVTSLDLTGPFDEAAMRAIANGFAAHLRKLQLDAHSPHGEALFSTDYPELESVLLNHTVYGDDGIAALVRAAPRLRDAHLRESRFAAAGAAALASSSLTTLRVTGTPLIDLVPPLARSTSLTSLSLDAPSMSIGVAHALATSSLRALRLGWKTKTEIGALRRLLESELRVFEVQNTPLGAEGARAIAGGTAPLEELVIQSCALGAEGARVLAESPSLAGLRRLGLAVNGIGDEGARALAESAHLGDLRRLDVENVNGLTIDGATALANSNKLAKLETLLVFSNAVPLDKPVDAPPHRIVAQQPVHPSYDGPARADTNWSVDPGWRWRLAD